MRLPRGKPVTSKLTAAYTLATLYCRITTSRDLLVKPEQGTGSYIVDIDPPYLLNAWSPFVSQETPPGELCNLAHSGRLLCDSGGIGGEGDIWKIDRLTDL